MITNEKITEAKEAEEIETEKTEKKQIKEILLKRFLTKKIISIFVMLIIAIVAIVCVRIFLYNEKPVVNTEYIISKLEKASELTTAELTYKGFTSYEDEGVIIINKASFRMLYTATARAGIDVSKIEVKPDDMNKKVLVIIPKAEILGVDVDPTSIEYFDEKVALFNLNSKEDANKAEAMAEDAAEKELANMGILQMADDQAETLIRGLLEEAIPDSYCLEVKRMETNK